MSKSCDRCKRTGLAILPVTYAVVPKSEASALNGPSGNLAAGIQGKSLQHAHYILRGLPAGYVYLLCGQSWRGYVVDSAGYPRYYPNLAIEDMPAAVPANSDVVQCERQGKNHTGVEAITIDRPDLIKGPVYIAFSRFKWTPTVRKQHASDPTKRMQLVADLSGKEFAGAVRASPDTLRQQVADFSPSARILQKHFWEAEQIPLRSGKEDALIRAMADMSGELKTTGIIMALDDSVGLTWSLNRLSKRLQAQLAELQGMGNDKGHAERARKRVIAEVIEGIRLNAQANPGPWYNRNYGPDRYLKHIEQGAWQAALAEAKDVKQLQKNISLASKDFVTWKESVGWKNIQAKDFDPLNDASARDHEMMVAMSVVGTGLTKDEHEKVWQPVLKLAADSPDNWLYRALAALKPDFLAYIAADKKEDKEYDAVKNAAAIAKEITFDSITKLAGFHAALRAKRQAGDSTNALIESISAMLFRMREDNPQGFNKLMRAVTSALICRGDVAPQPIAVKGVGSRVAAAIHQIAQIREMPNGGAPVIHKPITGKPGTRKGNFGGKAWELADAAGAEVVFKAPGSKEEVKTTVAWVLHRLRSGSSLNEKLLRSLDLKHVDLTLPAAKGNPFVEAHLTRLGAKADRVLSFGGTLFQVYSFNNALKTYAKGGTADQVDGGVGMVSAVLSASAGLAEIRAATHLLMGNKAAASAWLVRAGMLSLIAGIVEGAYLIVKGVNKALSTQDKDSAYWTMGTGVFVVMGGVAAAGATGAISIAGLALGPVAWACIAIALLGAAVYCSMQAWATDDANLLPVEYWLDNGAFGKRQQVQGDAAQSNPYRNAEQKTVGPFESLAKEIEELQRVLFVAQGRMWTAKDRNGIGIVCNYDVAVPRFELGSRLEILFIAIDEGQRKQVGRIVCEDGKPTPTESHLEPRMTGLRQGPTLQHDTKAATLRLNGLFATLQDPTLVNKAFDAFGWHKDTNVYADSFEMKVKYWPDRVNLPNLCSDLLAT